MGLRCVCTSIQILLFNDRCCCCSGCLHRIAVRTACARIMVAIPARCALQQLKPAAAAAAKSTATTPRNSQMLHLSALVCLACCAVATGLHAPGMSNRLDLCRNSHSTAATTRRAALLQWSAAGIAVTALLAPETSLAAEPVAKILSSPLCEVGVGDGCEAAAADNPLIRR